MTTFFVPQNINNSGWQKIGTDVSLITPTDRVLIGVTSSDLSTPIVVSPSIYAVSAAVNASVTGISTIGGTASFVSTSTGTGTVQPITFYCPTERMRITTSGFVGINNATPTSLLHIISGADGDILKIERSTGAVYSVNLSTSLATIGVSTNHPLKIITNNVTALYIDTSQRLGIGTITPAFALDIKNTSVAPSVNIDGSTFGSVLRLTAGGSASTASITSTSGKLQIGVGGGVVLNIEADTTWTLGGTSYTGAIYRVGGGSKFAFNPFPATAYVQIGADIADTGFKLYVLGSTKLDGTLTFTDTITTTDFTKQVSLGITKLGSSSAIDASALLELVSTTQGLLLPRMTTAQRDAISSPASGLVIYNTTTGKLNFRAAAAWEAVTSV